MMVPAYQFSSLRPSIGALCVDGRQAAGLRIRLRFFEQWSDPDTVFSFASFMSKEKGKDEI